MQRTLSTPSSAALALQVSHFSKGRTQRVRSFGGVLIWHSNICSIEFSLESAEFVCVTSSHVATHSDICNPPTLTPPEP